MNATDQEIHNALTDQIFMTFCAARMMGIQDPEIHTVASRGMIEAYMRAFPCLIVHHGGSKQFQSISGSRLFIVETMDVWSFSRVMNLPK